MQKKKTLVAKAIDYLGHYSLSRYLALVEHTMDTVAKTINNLDHSIWFGHRALAKHAIDAVAMLERTTTQTELRTVL